MTTAVAARRVVTPFSALDHCHYVDGTFTVVKRVTVAGPYVNGRLAYPGVFVLETLVQAARRCLGVPDLILSSVDSARLRRLPSGTVLTLRPEVTETADGCAITADSMTVRCRRPGPADLPAGVVVPAARVRTLADPAALLPHRRPALLVDTVSRHIPGIAATAGYTVTADEPCYRGRAPGPYPAVLVLESFAQSCAAVLRLEHPATRGFAPRHARGITVHGAVLPGQTLVHDLHLSPEPGGARLSGRTTADGRPVLTVDGLDLKEAGTTG